MRIAILSPAYPPTINGLGDYALLLGNSLQTLGMQIIYIGLVQEQKVKVSDYIAIEAGKQSLLKVVEANKIDILFINYSGYGYHRKGYPVWLVEASRDIKNLGIGIAVFFHEIYAAGAFWQPVFWYSFLQRKVFRQLYELADVAFCSNNIVFNLVAQQTPDKAGKCKNVGLIANIPEPEMNRPITLRRKQAVIFGTKGRREAVYRHWTALQQCFKQWGVNTVVDIGEPIEHLRQNTKGVTIIEKGILSKELITVLIQESILGIIDYPHHLLGKSGIFAAYAACGTLVLNTAVSGRSNEDGLVEGLHYFSLKGFHGLPGSIDLDKAGKEVFTWYKQHDLATHSSTICRHLKEVIGGDC